MQTGRFAAPGRMIELASVGTIRNSVAAFWRNDGQALRCEEDAFPAWFLHSRFHLAPQEALAQSSDGNFDGGLDAFHLEIKPDGAPPTIWMIQGKYSEGPLVVKKGLDDIGRALDLVERLETHGDSELATENTVVQQFRRALVQARGLAGDNYNIKCALLHLLPDQELWLSSPSVVKARKDLMQRARNKYAGRVSIEYFGPEDLSCTSDVSTRSPRVQLNFRGIPLTEGPVKMFLGVGRLADLVDLHEKYHFHLFAKNVRMYLSRQANRDQSAANQIRKSLEAVCAGKMPAMHFALAHNGVTIACDGVQDAGDQLISLEGSSGVFVLNGCQTVYTSWKYFKEMTRKGENQAWMNAWREIPIPMRIVVTADDGLVRKTTIGSNRQTAMSPSAFWAHDPIQIAIELKWTPLVGPKLARAKRESAWVCL
jgi:hypothetical protein